MSSLVTQMVLVEKYGLRLTVEQLAEVLGRSKGTVYNQISAGSFEIHTFVDGNKRFADYRDVAEYLDACRGRAREATV